MTRMNFFYSIFFLFALIIAMVNLTKSITLKKVYVQFFNKSAIFSHYDDKGKLDGEFITYIKGKIHIKAYFKEGLREGWDVEYYTNGQVKNERLFKMGSETDLENEYYESGKLDYKANWRNNNHYGSEWHWLENGTIAIYNATDFKGLFYYSEYDSKGKLKKVFGSIISNNIYSKIHPTDSVILLNNNEHYNNINDLYIVVATPPNLTPEISININQIPIKSFEISNNTISLKNIFSVSGSYRIQVRSKLKQPNNRILRKDSLDIKIIKN